MESGLKTSAQLFSDILKLQNKGSLPPVDDWNPPLCENVQMKISRDGKWFFMDSPIGREKMVSLFSTVLRFDEDGNYYVHNEGNVEIVSGKKTNGDVGINIASQKASIAITCTGDGNILIKGSSVVIQAREDISLKAGRNISLNAPQTIDLNANKVQANGKSGNIMKAIFHVVGGAAGSFVGRVFANSRVGRDKL